MSSTNKTSYYELSQYIGTDIPNPLTDYNNDMSKIDTALHNVAETVASDSASVTDLGNRVSVVEGNIETLATQAGSDALATTAQTLSGGVNELKAGVDDNASDIATLNTAIASKADSSQLTALATRVTNAETKIGTTSLNTTAQDLSGAVNELKSAVDAIPSATIDTAMSASSTNAVQNKVIKEYVDNATAGITVAEVQRDTLTAGSTSLTLTFNATIGTNTLVDWYVSDITVSPTNITTTSNTIVFTFEAQSNALTVGAKIQN